MAGGHQESKKLVMPAKAGIQADPGAFNGKHTGFPLARE